MTLQSIHYDPVSRQACGFSDQPNDTFQHLLQLGATGSNWGLHSTRASLAVTDTSESIIEDMTITVTDATESIIEDMAITLIYKLFRGQLQIIADKLCYKYF